MKILIPLEYLHNADIMVAMDNHQLKSALSELAWSQAELARRLDCDINTVNRWATGKVPVPGHVVEYLRVMRLAKQIMEG